MTSIDFRDNKIEKKPAEGRTDDGHEHKYHRDGILHNDDPQVRQYFLKQQHKLYQESLLRSLMERVYNCSPFYRQLMLERGISPRDIRTLEDLSIFPFTEKEDLRTAYPLGFMAAPEEYIVRIHSSSGTTGKPIIVPYTQKDVDVWAEMMARCFRLAGVTRNDRVQITPGYGLWTAGIGFQAGVEKMGAMVIPTGAGNTEKQIEMMVDMQSTAIAATSSYGLLLAEEINRRGLRDKIALRIGVIGSERWSDKMRDRIQQLLNIDTFDIYGLTEIYGPGIALDCSCHQGLHYWDDHLLFEIIDPETGEVLPDGEEGELVITTLTKEGMPLIRYRTHDLTRKLTETCSCGSEFPMIDRVLGRTDDRIKLKGVNIYPGQIDFVLHQVQGAGSEYQIVLNRDRGRDSMLLRVEAQPGADFDQVGSDVSHTFRSRIGIQVDVEVVANGGLPRSEKKSKRIIDNREC